MVRKTPVPKTARKKARKTVPGTAIPRAPRSRARQQPPAIGRKPATAESPPWTNAEIEEGFRRFQAANPEPVGELQYVTPFTLLVAVVLSAQATHAGVNKATPPLFAAANTPAKMVALGEARVRDYIKTIGLYRTKAKNLVPLVEKLIAEHGGMVPPL